MGLEKIKREIETLGHYYDCFTNENNEGVCPFCGLMPIDGEFDPTRDAFDHYLPKSKYPFNSVNLKNLVPSCHKCNSDNKKDKDPLHNRNGDRRKAFFPFSDKHADIEVYVSILKKKWIDLKPEEINIKFGPTELIEELDTWKALYRIDQRYSTKCCSKNGGIHWINRVLNECQNYNLTPNEMLTAEIQSVSSNPWCESNFLKKAFLEGCERAGLFSADLEED